MRKTLLAAVAVILSASASFAATLSGNFTVQAVQGTNLNATQSQATLANFNTLLGSSTSQDVFSYSGDLFFGTSDSSDSTTISDWLGTGTPGGVSGLDATFGGLQLSKPNIKASVATATSTFFLFTLDTPLTAGTFSGRHDDGITMFINDAIIGQRVGPNSVKSFSYTSTEAGVFSLLYVATNGDPSILEVSTTASPVPLPASAWLLLAGVGGLAAYGRRKQAA